MEISNGLLIRRFNQETDTSVTKRKSSDNTINSKDNIDTSNHSTSNIKDSPKNNPKYRSSMQQRDLISGRDFNEILQACRPMYRGESNIALPSALKASLVLGRSNDDGSNERKSDNDPPTLNDAIDNTNTWPPFSLGTPLITNSRSISIEQQYNTEDAQSLSMHLQEWGTVNFIEFSSLQQQQQQLALSLNNNLTIISHESPPWESASVTSFETASPSSSFNSNFSYLLNRRCTSGGGITTTGAIDEMYELSGSVHQRLGSTDTTKLSPLFGGLQIQKPSSYDFLSMESYFPSEMLLKYQQQQEQSQQAQQKVKKETTPKKEKFRRNLSEVLLYTSHDKSNEDLLGHHSSHVPLSSSFGPSLPTTRTGYPRSKSGGDEKEINTTIIRKDADNAKSDLTDNLKLLMKVYDNQIFTSSLSQKSIAKQQSQQQHLISNSVMGNSSHSMQSILVPSVLEKNNLLDSKSFHGHPGGANDNSRGAVAAGTRVKRSGKSGGEGIGAALTNYNKFVNEARARHQQQDASCLTYPPVLPNANTQEIQKARRKILEWVKNNQSSTTQSAMITSRSPDKSSDGIKPLGRLPEHRSTSLQGDQQQQQQVTTMDVKGVGPTVNRLPDHVYSSGIMNQYPYNMFFAAPSANNTSNPSTVMNRTSTTQPAPITVSHGLAGNSSGASTKHHVISERTKLITPTSTDNTQGHRRKANSASAVSFNDTKKSDNNANITTDKQQQQQSHLKVAHQRVLKHISKKHHEHHHSADQATRKKSNRHHKHHHSKRHTSRSSSNKQSDVPMTSTNTATTTATTTHHRKPWVLNPFRQRDETEILSRRTANRRRWSHVFPLGEEEFKRHSGPLWNSLCQPAVLPLTIDVFPSPKELNNTNKFQFNPYQITLDAMDGTYYKNNTDLLEEMITQRLIQDFQIVPPSVVQSAKRAEVEDMRKARQSVKANRSRRRQKDELGGTSSHGAPDNYRRRSGLVGGTAADNDKRRSSMISVGDSGGSSGGLIEALNPRPRRRGSSNTKVDKIDSPLSRAVAMEGREKETLVPNMFGVGCSPPTGFSRYMQNIATGDYDDPLSSSGSTVQCTLSMVRKIIFFLYFCNYFLSLFIRGIKYISYHIIHQPMILK